MAYSEKVIDHYENPRNVGKMDAEDTDVGTGMVGAPACGDVMRLQIKVNEASTEQWIFTGGSASSSASWVLLMVTASSRVLPFIHSVARELEAIAEPQP